MNNNFNKTLIASYIKQTEKIDLNQTNMQVWLNIYNKYETELEIEQKIIIFQQLLICVTNTEPSVDAHLQIIKIKEYLESVNMAQVQNLLDRIMNLKETKNVLSLKLTSLFYLSNIEQNLNKYDILTKSVKKTRTKLYIPRTMWRTVWPHLNNITNDTKQKNIIAIVLDSNTMIGQTNSNTTDGIYDALSNFRNNKLTVSQSTLDTIWNIMLNNCKGATFQLCILKALSRVYDNDYHSHAQHINALIRTKPNFISTFSKNILWQHKNGTLPLDILGHLQNVSIKDADDLILSQVLQVCPDRIKEIYDSQYAQRITTTSSLINMYLHATRLESMYIIEQIMKYKNTDLAESYDPEINKCVCTYIKHHRDIGHLEINKINKILSLYKNEDLKFIIIKLMSKLTEKYLYPYEDATKNEMHTPYVICARRALSGTSIMKILNPEQLEFKIVKITAPEKLEQLQNEWLQLLNKNEDLTTVEDIKLQDTLFFKWLQKELLQKEPISIEAFKNLRDMLGTTTDQLIESWSLNTAFQNHLDIEDMQFIMD